MGKTKELISLGEEVREKLVKTRQSILNVTESTSFSGAHVALLRLSSLIRNPYIDPINIIQAELMKRLRKLDKRTDLSSNELEEKELLKDALKLSIKGIAQGMKNSG